MKASDPRTVVCNTTKRDAVIATIAGLLVLSLMVFGFVQFAREAGRSKNNVLTGTVVDKQFTPAPEEQINFSKKGMNSKKIEGEYVLKVRVETEGRTFEVPVEKTVYELKKVGEPLTFLRPSSERQ